MIPRDQRKVVESESAAIEKGSASSTMKGTGSWSEGQAERREAGLDP